MRRALWRPAGGQELLEHVFLPQVVVGRYDAAEGAPGVGVHAELLAQPVGLGAVDEIEAQRELLPHLVAPLQPERRGGQYEDALHPPAHYEFDTVFNQFRDDPEQWVAILNEKVVGGSSDVYQLIDELREKDIPTERVVLRHLTREEELLIL